MPNKGSGLTGEAPPPRGGTETRENRRTSRAAGEGQRGCGPRLSADMDARLYIWKIPAQCQREDGLTRQGRPGDRPSLGISPSLKLETPISWSSSSTRAERRALREWSAQLARARGPTLPPRVSFPPGKLTRELQLRPRSLGACWDKPETLRAGCEGASLKTPGPRTQQRPTPRSSGFLLG